MKMITLWQPRATLVAIGAKPYETRSFPPPRKLLGRRIAIHAAVRPVRLADFDPATAIAIQSALWPAGDQPFDWHKALPRGAIVCTVLLTGAYRLGESYRTRWQGKEQDVVSIAEELPGSRSIDSLVPIDPFGDYSAGRWIWRCEDVRQLATPLPRKGKQGWGEVSDYLVTESAA